MDRRRVVIVGTGEVGASLAFALMIRGTATHIFLKDKDEALAEGHMMDLNHGRLFVPPVKIDTKDTDDYLNCEIAVITAGASQKPGQTRMDLVQKNTQIFKNLVPEVVEQFQPRILLIVTNPVDVLTYVALKLSGYDPNHVIGSGTLLDSARFRSLLSNHCGVHTKNIHAYIIGEHGDSEVLVWSQTNVAGVAFEAYCKSCDNRCSTKDREDIEKQVKQAAYEIIQKKGATSYAVALALVRIIDSIFRDENSVLTVSSFIDDYYGISDVCLSVPTIINRNCVTKRLALDLDDSEIADLKRSADTLKSTIDQLAF